MNTGNPVYHCRFNNRNRMSKNKKMRVSVIIFSLTLIPMCLLRRIYALTMHMLRGDGPLFPLQPF